MKFKLFGKNNYVEWDEYVERINAIEDFIWSQSARRTFI